MVNWLIEEKRRRKRLVNWREKLAREGEGGAERGGWWGLYREEKYEVFDSES